MYLFRKKNFPKFLQGQKYRKIKILIKKIAQACQLGNIQILSPERPFNQNLI